MFMHKRRNSVGMLTLLMLAVGCGGLAAQSDQQPQSSLGRQLRYAGDMPRAGVQYGVGVAASASQVAAWNIDIQPDGSNLPTGSGSVSQGRILYGQACASCHGQQGEGKPMDRLVGGKGTLNTATPVKTVGSYWPYATSVYDYIHRAMPFNAPGTLTPDQVYAATAYLLHMNGIVPENAVLDARSLPKVQMPNRDGFLTPDPRPDVKNTACMTGCLR
jgi:mono/diheme cytochrome c family protein